MISKKVSNILFVASIACIGYGVYKSIKQSKGYDKEVSLGVDKLVNDQFGEELGEAKLELSMAKGNTAAIVRAEQVQIDAEVNADADFVSAQSAFNANNTEINILKKNLKTAESSGTSVSVGSGNSAVAVQVKDTAAINDIKSKIAHLEAENVINKNNMKRIRNAYKIKVQSARTEDQKLMFQKVTDAERKITGVNIRKETYKNDLLNNDTVMYAVQKVAYKKYFTPKKVLVIAGSMTLAGGISLFMLWDWALSCIKTYHQLEG